MADGRWFLEQHRILAARCAPRVGWAVAEDLASEAVVRCLRSPPPDGRNGPWLERNLQNLLADHFRHHALRSRRRWLVDEPAFEPGPEELLLRKERLGGLASIWPRIDPDLRQALEGRFFENRGDAEVAAASKLATTTVRTRVCRGLARLRGALAKVRAWMPLPLAAGAQPLALVLVPTAIMALLLAPAGPVAPSVTRRVERARLAQARPVAKPAPAASVPTVGPAVDRPAPPRAGSRSAPAKTPPTRFDFGDDVVEGELQRPDEVIVLGGAPRAKHPSLIEIPSSFVAAIGKSLEEL